MKVFWTCYLIAQLMHMASKAYFVIGSNKNGITSYGQFFKVNVVPLVIRFGMATALFFWWLDDPTLINKTFDKIGAQFSPGLVQSFIMGIGFPLNAGTSFFYGIAVDSVFDKVIGLVPMFQKTVPPFRGDTEIVEEEKK